MPVAADIFREFRNDIHGVIHCSGGAQTKVLNFVSDLHIIKNNLFELPPLFRLIQEQSGTPWKEMYQVFNMGHRLEFYVPEKIAGLIIEIANSYNIDARIVGRCEGYQGKKLSINSERGRYEY